MTTTLAEAIRDERVGFDVLHERYDPVLQMVDVLIGVVPNCDMYLEVWEPGFRTYNLMVPNFLNLPASLFGRAAPKDVVGLGMYASSRAASCNYCSAHTCSFALRRGSSADAVTGASRTPGEAATVAVAEALSSDPHNWNARLRVELHKHYSDDDAEWIVMGVAMMGFLNKFMDAMGVELEREAVGDVAALITPTGWSVGQHDWADGDLGNAGGAIPRADSLSTLLTILRNAPGAVRLDRKWMDGMPDEGQAARRRLHSEYRYDEELLVHMRHTKPRRALAAMLRHNLDPDQSSLGIGLKALAAVVYGTHVGNFWLTARSAGFAERRGIDRDVIDAVRSGIDVTDSALRLDDRTVAVVAGALAMSPSPSVVDATTISLVTDHLSAEEIVELAVWISVSQLQHRLALWYGLSS